MTTPPISIADGYPLKNISSPHPHDVLCGRGGGTNNHIGNNHWRALVAANKQLYVTLAKRQKMLLSKSIVNAVRSQQPPGRFLQKDNESDLWFDVGDQKATEKTSQALREGAPSIRKTKAREGDEAAATADSTGPTGAATLQSNSGKSGTTAYVKAAPKTKLVPPYVPPPGVGMVPGANGMPPPPPVSSPGMMCSPQQMMAMNMYAAGMMQRASMSPNMMQFPMGMPPMPQEVASQSPASAPKGRKHISDAQKKEYAKEAEAAAGKNSDPSKQPQQQPPPPQQQFNQQQPPNNPNMPPPPPPGVRFDFEQMASMVQPLEPTGISFGSISMTSVEQNRLQPTGTSFGSVSMASGNRVLPVDGGLEPAGLSYGSQFSINTADHDYIQNVILEPDPIREKSNGEPSYETTTLLEQQKSRGNLLECSDTDSDDEDQDSKDSGQKAEEWQKLQDTVQSLQSVKEKTGKTEKGSGAPPPMADAPAQPDFARDVSAMSAISLMSLEPYAANRMQSTGGASLLPPDLNPDVSIAFSEMSLSRDVSLADPLAGAEHEHKPQPPPPADDGGGVSPSLLQKHDDALSEEEKLQKLFLQRGGSLVFENFGRSGKGSA